MTTVQCSDDSDDDGEGPARRKPQPVNPEGDDPTADDTNPRVPLKGSIRVALRGSFKGFLGF